MTSDLIVINLPKWHLNCVLMADLKGFRTLLLPTMLSLLLLLSPTQHQEEDNWSITLIEQSGQPAHRSRCANLHSLRQTWGLNHFACCDWQHKQFCFFFFFFFSLNIKPMACLHLLCHQCNDAHWHVKMLASSWLLQDGRKTFLNFFFSFFK